MSVLQTTFNSFLTAKYCISWEGMKTVNTWLPSTVSQLGGTKRNSPVSPAKQQKWVLFPPPLYTVLMLTLCCGMFEAKI